MTRMLSSLLCFKLENFCSFERNFAELDQNTSAGERERIRIDFWDWIVHSHGIPTLNDDEIELQQFHGSVTTAEMPQHKQTNTS